MPEAAGGPNVEGPKEDVDEKMQETWHGHWWLPWKWVEMSDSLFVDV